MRQNAQINTSLKIDDFDKGNLFFHKGKFREIFVAYSLEKDEDFINVLER